MALFCSCGAELPDNARFCFRCGKPQREQDLPVVAEAPVAPPLPTAPIIGFSNPVAVRLALLCASLSILINVILIGIHPVLRFACCLWLVGAGFLSVALYGWKTGLEVSVREGARLGWMTGLFTFVVELVLTAVTLVFTRSAGAFREALRQAMEKMGTQGEAARQVLEWFNSPVALAAFVLFSIVMQFLVTVALSVTGGAMAAKVREKD